MFEAYSETKDSIVNIQTEYNLDELFKCPNPNCTAKFIIKSSNGKKAKHFARLRSTPHTFGCPYDLNCNINTQDENIIRSSVFDIFNDSVFPSQTKSASCKNYNVKSDSTLVKYIRTPRQLLTLCINSNLDDDYLDGLKIGDIILDNRNLLTDANFKGICGLRFVLAETVRYERPDTLYLKLWTRTKNNKMPTLKVTVIMNEFLLDELVKYIFETYGNFGRHSIAVFGNWLIDKPYNIVCVLADKKHIIYKF